MIVPASEIQNIWQIIATGPTSILEMRAIWPKGVAGKKTAVTRHYRASDYTSLDKLRNAFEQEALWHNETGYNIYVVMNPIKPTFIGKNVGDADIEYRDLILIDIDKVAKPEKPSTDLELDAACKLADKVSDYLSNNYSWPKPIRIMSGNGHHLYYPVNDMQNSEETKQIVRDFLKTLANQFDNTVVRIDTSVFNASRITKVVGTIARKGLETPERPHRMAKLYEC